MHASVRRNRIFALTITLAAAGSSVAASRAGAGSPAPAPRAAGDGVPSGTVAFFSVDEGVGCPDDWVPAVAAAGRLVLGVTAPDAVGVLVGLPLAAEEDRTHAHPYTSAIELATKNIAGANGGNNSGAQSGTHAITETTLAATSGLPFTQLLMCEKP